MILRQVKEGITKPFSFNGMQKIVHTMRDKLDLPSTFTLDTCRHGGMTELEEAELTDGQGRALSAHKSQQAYDAGGTNVQNELQNHIQNAETANNQSGAK
jgi:hypothetical protein